MLKSILSKTSIIKNTTTLNFVRNFQSVSTGETFGTIKPISEFLTQPTKVSTLPYFVKRTKFLSLPIYSDFKNGRSRRLTVIRRVEGDVEQLRQDLSSIIPIKEMYVHRLTGHLVIKGSRVHEVRDFLTTKGF